MKMKTAQYLLIKQFIYVYVNRYRYLYIDRKVFVLCALLLFGYYFPHECFNMTEFTSQAKDEAVACHLTWKTIFLQLWVWSCILLWLCVCVYVCAAIKKPIFGAKLMFIAMYDDDNDELDDAAAFDVDGDDELAVTTKRLLRLLLPLHPPLLSALQCLSSRWWRQSVNVKN